MSGIATQADVLRIEAQGLPADLPASTYDMLRRGAAIDPQAPALSFFLTADTQHRPERWCYAELLQAVHRTANLLRRLGVRRDSVVAYVLPNLPETHFVIWGGEAAGIVFAVNPLLEPAAIADLLNAAGASVLVTLAPFPGTDLWQKVHGILPQLPKLRHVVLVDLGAHLRAPKRWIAALLQRRLVTRLHGRGGLRAAVPAHIELHDHATASARERGDALAFADRPQADAVSSYFCTGGTTGLPKIAKRTHRNEVANAWSAGQFLGDGIGTGKTVFCGLPLFHVNAVLATGLLPFSKGAHVVLGTPQGYRGEGVVAGFWRIVQQHRINFFSGVPTLYSTLLEVPVNGADLSSLEYGLCGAAPMPVEVFRQFQQRTGIRILEGYGLTEGCCVSSVNPPLGERRLGSIGLRIPGQSMKAVVLDDSGAYVRDCGIDEVGLIVIAGPNVFSGYLQAEHNRGLWIDSEGQRWLNTGDLGRQDAEGYFWLTGRRKDLIIRGGHNIDPGLIEEALHRHSLVQVAAAIGRPDAHAGELPVAYVQLKPGAAIDAQTLQSFLRDEIVERAALPKQIRIVDAMPLTPVGKIFKPELRRRETVEVVKAVLAEHGIAAAQVAACDDRTHGLVVELALQDPDQLPRAEQALGRYPLKLRMLTAAQTAA